MRLDKKVALITGAGSGIGRASALLFAKEGAKVSVLDMNPSGGQETVDVIKKNGGEAKFIKADVSKASDMQQAVKTTLDAYGRLDILFNNAGILRHLVPIEELDEADWDRMFAVNVKGVFLGCKYAVPIMKRQGGGIIINESSTAATHPIPYHYVYSAAKAGIITFTKVLAMDLASHNIRVNCLVPGGVDTPIYNCFSPAQKEALSQFLTESVPMGRIGKPEELAYAALYLASDEASYTTGTTLVVDGGQIAGFNVKY